MASLRQKGNERRSFTVGMMSSPAGTAKLPFWYDVSDASKNKVG